MQRGKQETNFARLKKKIIVVFHTCYSVTLHLIELLAVSRQNVRKNEVSVSELFCEIMYRWGKTVTTHIELQVLK